MFRSKKKEEIHNRVIKIADRCIDTHQTVRQLAEENGTSKSTVHKDLSERLEMLDGKRYCQVQAVLQFNKTERHIRGGEATRQKYLEAKKSKST